MSLIKTGWWWAKIPDDHIRISISHGSPRGVGGGWRVYRALAPGPWFRSVPPREYLTLYAEILAGLDPAEVAGHLATLGGNKLPVLCCFEAVRDIASGAKYCHRHLAAA